MSFKGVNTAASEKKKHPREKKKNTPAYTGQGLWSRDKKKRPPAYTGRACCFPMKKTSRKNVQQKRKARPAVLAWQSAVVVALFRCFIPHENFMSQDSNFPQGVHFMVSFSSFWASVYVSGVCMLKGCVLYKGVLRVFRG